MNTANPKTLQLLFPVPSLPPSKLAPGHSPGISPQSTEALQEVLKDNHVKWHIFLNEAQFHNHAPHRSLAAWALGADANAIRTGYKKDCESEKPALVSPGSITWENFNDHLGDDRYFVAYMQFFVAFVQDKGIPATLEEFVFSQKANLGSGNLPQEKQPQMLNRFLAGLLHPIIHTGYGAEFGLPGTLVEGLAEAAVHKTHPGLLNSLHLFDNDLLAEKMSNVDIAGVTGSVLSRTADIVGPTLNAVLPQPLAGMALGSDADQQKSVASRSDLHALTILARVLQDQRFKPKPSSSTGKPPALEDVIEAHGQQIAAYVLEWDVDVKKMGQTGLWEKKFEELVWCVTVLYGVAGWVDGKNKGGFNADFFFMHLVTSAVFLPSLCGLVAAQSRVRLLKAYLHYICLMAIFKGQPRLDVKAFMEETKIPEKSAPAPTTHLGMAESTTTSIAWDQILEKVRVHKDEHLTKTIRSLAAWGSAFGSKQVSSGLGDSEIASPKQSYEYLPKTDLEGSEYLDGSLFLRVAVLTMQKDANWDFRGFAGQHAEAAGKVRA